jgi:hypothetical protein
VKYQWIARTAGREPRSTIARTAGREPRSTIGPLYDRYKKNTATRADPLGSILKIETQWDRRKPFERDNV